MASVGTRSTYKVPGFSDEESDLLDALNSICDDYDKEEKNERDERRPLWLKLENYFNGLQRRFWDETAKDWRRLPDELNNETARHYDKIINIYRAHAESVIAALSVRLPSAIFYPEDADVIEDVQTAQACIRIKQLIERHNDSQLLFIKILMILFNTGVCASYIYNRKSTQYGIFKKPIYGDPVKVKTILLNCVECGSNIDELVFKGDEKVKIPDESRECQVCGYKGVPDTDESEEEVPEIKGYQNEAKYRTRIEPFSPLFVHMPFYARSQELMPYLNLRFEQHYSLLKATYPKLAKANELPSSSRVDVDNERRLLNVGSNNLVTTECRWFRPWAFEIHADDKIVKRLKKKFPDGVYLIRLEQKIVEAHNESLDDHWEISKNPLSIYLHAEPLGKPLAPIQDLQNEVTDLQIETFEHAIPETFVDGEVLNFKKYSESRAAPGMKYPVVKPKDGSPIGSAFHTTKTATLSEEAELFSRKLDDKGQFVLGSFPSIYGGPATSGSKTAREYTESRAMALQRLTITWNLCKYHWAAIMGKAVPLFIKALKETNQDERFVDREKKGNQIKFINVWVRQSELTGTIGRVEADAEEGLPQSPSQIKDVLLQLMTLKDENINAALMHPENTPVLAKALGAPDFYIPGADDRDKQYAEIAAILADEEVEVQQWENHQIEAATCKSFLTSQTGMGIKTINQEGYDKIVAHMNAHVAMLQGAGDKGLAPKTSPETVNSEGVMGNES